MNIGICKEVADITYEHSNSNRFFFSTRETKVETETETEVEITKMPKMGNS